MKKILLLLIVFLCSCGVDFTPYPHENHCEQPKWTVHFSPRGGVTQHIVKAIESANTSVYVQAYSFTSVKIAEALVAKKKQGKTVVVLVDKSSVDSRGSVVRLLVNNRVPVYIDGRHAIAHNKVIIIDEIIVLTGSFNFTNAAENSNAENSLELRDAALAKKYLGNWRLHREHSLSR